MSPTATCKSHPAKAIITHALTWIVGIACVLVLIGKAAIELSPMPRVLLLRWAFDGGSKQMSEALAKHVPAGISERLNEHYDPADPDAFLDVYFPSELEGSERVRPAVVWVHGGGWISGDKNEVANYARILSSKGFTVASVGYSIAPDAKYPKPIQQIVAALAYLQRNAGRLHMDASKIVLAGNASGAQMVAQVANIISSPAYATTMEIASPLERSQLAGVILYCGPYDLGRMNLDGWWGMIPKALLWAYAGKKEFLDDPRVATMSVINFVTADFPPTFISSGNDDGVTPQSHAFADTLDRLGVEVDRLFFKENHTPPLGPDYQFNLDIEDGQRALARSVSFLKDRIRARSLNASSSGPA